MCPPAPFGGSRFCPVDAAELCGYKVDKVRLGCCVGVWGGQRATERRVLLARLGTEAPVPGGAGGGVLVCVCVGGII